jgi:serine phosphatase RsbU (regulator of sigma subunit)
LAGRNLPIGMIDDAAHGEEGLRLGRGDCLYFLTDGVVEASSGGGDPFGLHRLHAGIARCRDFSLCAGLDRIAAEILDWCDGRPSDDVTLLAVERTRCATLQRAGSRATSP